MKFSSLAGRFSGVAVRPRGPEDIGQLWKRFERKWRGSGLKQELRDREGFQSKGQKRRSKRARAVFQQKRSQEADDVKPT